jgi:hypothetical protein
MVYGHTGYVGHLVEWLHGELGGLTLYSKMSHLECNLQQGQMMKQLYDDDLGNENGYEKGRTTL